MSTRSGKRIHNSPDGDIINEYENLGNGIKTRSKNSKKDNETTEKKRKKHYVKYPSEEGPEEGESNDTSNQTLRTSRRNTLKERNLNDDAAKDSQVQHSLKITRRTKRREDPGEYNSTVDDAEGKKNKKKSKRKKIALVENKDILHVQHEKAIALSKKKSMKKKSKKKSNSVVVEDITENPKILNTSEVSDSFHSAAGSPGNLENCEQLNLSEKTSTPVQKKYSTEVQSSPSINNISIKNKHINHAVNHNVLCEQQNSFASTDEEPGSTRLRKRKSSAKIENEAVKGNETAEHCTKKQLKNKRKLPKSLFKENALNLDLHQVESMDDQNDTTNENTIYTKCYKKQKANRTFNKVNTTFDKEDKLNDTYDKKNETNCTLNKNDESTSTSSIEENKSNVIFDKEKEGNTIFDKKNRTNTTLEKKNKVSDTFDKNDKTNSTFDKDDKANSTFDEEDKANSTFDKKDKANSSFDKKDKANSTFDKEDKASSIFDIEDKANSTFDKKDKSNTTFERVDRTSNKFDKNNKYNATFDKEDETNSKFDMESEANTTFDEKDKINRTFDKEDKPNSIFDMKDKANTAFNKNDNCNSTFDNENEANSTFDKSDNIPKLNNYKETFDKILKVISPNHRNSYLIKRNSIKINNKISGTNVSLDNISNDNSNESIQALDTSKMSHISVTSDESQSGNVLNNTPLLVESSLEEVNISGSSCSPTPCNVSTVTPTTPLKREGTFTKESPDLKIQISKNRKSVDKTPTRRKSLPSPGCTPFPLAKTKDKSILNVTRSIEKSRRSSLADLVPRATKVMFCSPSNNPVVVSQMKGKIIKSSLKGSNKSFIFDDSSCPSPPRVAGRKRSQTADRAAGAVAEPFAKRSRLAGPPTISAPSPNPPRLRTRTLSASAKLPEKSAAEKADTPAKERVRTRLPNFAALHARQFARMESLDECQRRRAERARLLLTPTGPAASPKVTENQAPKPSESAVKKAETPTKGKPPQTAAAGYSRFGFKLQADASGNPFSFTASKATAEPRVVAAAGATAGAAAGARLNRQATMPSLAGATRKQLARQTIMREKSFAGKRDNYRHESRTVIKGVRTNRRFELQMKMRNINA